MSDGSEIIFPGKHTCHSGAVEVAANLFCGSEAEALTLAKQTPELHTMVPLNSLSAMIWESGFRGEILYYPIRDYGVLPSDVLSCLVDHVLDRLKHDKKVVLFCMGGHGRTGYVASVILGKLGYDDPIAFLRAHYCWMAVESNAQVKHIAEVLKKPELWTRYENKAEDRQDLACEEFID